MIVKSSIFRPLPSRPSRRDDNSNKRLHPHRLNRSLSNRVMAYVTVRQVNSDQLSVWIHPPSSDIGRHMLRIMSANL